MASKRSASGFRRSAQTRAGRRPPTRSQIFDAERGVRAVPRALELAADEVGLAGAALRLEALGEAEERAAVAAVAAEVFAEDGLGRGVLFVHEQRAAQALA